MTFSRTRNVSIAFGIALASMSIVSIAEAAPRPRPAHIKPKNFNAPGGASRASGGACPTITVEDLGKKPGDFTMIGNNKYTVEDEVKALNHAGKELCKTGGSVWDLIHRYEDSPEAKADEAKVIEANQKITRSFGPPASAEDFEKISKAVGDVKEIRRKAVLKRDGTGTEINVPGSAGSTIPANVREISFSRKLSQALSGTARDVISMFDPYAGFSVRNEVLEGHPKTGVAFKAGVKAMGMAEIELVRFTAWGQSGRTLRARAGLYTIGQANWLKAYDESKSDDENFRSQNKRWGAERSTSGPVDQNYPFASQRYRNTLRYPTNPNDAWIEAQINAGLSNNFRFRLEITPAVPNDPNSIKISIVPALRAAAIADVRLGMGAAARRAIAGAPSFIRDGANALFNSSNPILALTAEVTAVEVQVPSAAMLSVQQVAGSTNRYTLALKVASNVSGKFMKARFAIDTPSLARPIKDLIHSPWTIFNYPGLDVNQNIYNNIANPWTTTFTSGDGEAPVPPPRVTPTEGTTPSGPPTLEDGRPNPDVAPRPEPTAFPPTEAGDTPAPVMQPLATENPPF